MGDEDKRPVAPQLGQAPIEDGGDFLFGEFTRRSKRGMVGPSKPHDAQTLEDAGAAVQVAVLLNEELRHLWPVEIAEQGVGLGIPAAEDVEDPSCVRPAAEVGEVARDEHIVRFLQAGNALEHSGVHVYVPETDDPHGVSSLLPNPPQKPSWLLRPSKLYPIPFCWQSGK